MTDRSILRKRAYRQHRGRYALYERDDYDAADPPEFVAYRGRGTVTDERDAIAWTDGQSVEATTRVVPVFWASTSGAIANGLIEPEGPAR